MKVVQLTKILKKTSKATQKEYMITLGKEMFLKKPQTSIGICQASKLK